MNKYVRLILVLALVTGLVLLARGNAVWANGSSDQSLSAPDQGMQAFADRKDDDCNRKLGKNKEKDKDKCKDKGSVKPPKKQVIIPGTGEYSVGGFCTLSIVLNKLDITLNASIQTPLPGELPDEVQRVRQGCLLTYYRSNQRIDSLSPSSGNTTICFAALPGKQMTLYFYDIHSPNPAWVPLQTTVQDGIACAAGKSSGVYVATFQKH